MESSLVARWTGSLMYLDKTEGIAIPVHQIRGFSEHARISKAMADLATFLDPMKVSQH